MSKSVNRLRTATGAFIFGMLAGSASADDCDAVLEKHLVDRTEIRNEVAWIDAFRRSACLKTHDEMRRTNGFDVGVQYKVFEADVGSSDTNWKQWQQSNCEDISRDHQESALYYFSQSAVNPRVIEAWRDCKIRRNDLFCHAEPEVEPEFFSVEVYWNPRGRRSTIVRSSPIRGAVDITNGSVSRELMTRGSVLNQGESRFLLQRSSTDKPSWVVVNLTYDRDTEHSCKVYVPGKPPKAPFKGVGIYDFGNAAKCCTVTQSGAQVIVQNERSSIGIADYEGPLLVIVGGSGWELGLRGVLQPNGDIKWDNRTDWIRSRQP